jgi:ABC-type multidrug transport system fused ATPase/permease subunit
MAVSAGASFQKDGWGVVCAVCGQSLHRSLWIVPLRLLAVVAVVASLLVMLTAVDRAPSQLRTAGALVAAVLSLAVPLLLLRYVTWRFVPLRNGNEMNRALTAGAKATVPAAWASLLGLVTDDPLLGVPLAGVPIWVLATLHYRAFLKTSSKILFLLLGGIVFWLMVAFLSETVVGRSRARMAQATQRVDLWRLAEVQAAFYAGDHDGDGVHVYAASLSQLEDSFSTSAGVTVRISAGDEHGWAAVTTHEQLSGAGCAIVVGNVPPPLTPGGARPIEDGVPVCDRP